MKSVSLSAGRLLLATALVCSLAACASSGGKKQPVVDYATLMKSAEAEVSAGRLDTALVRFNDAAKLDPTRKDAWVRSAQLHFDAGHYGRAIVAAEEVLKRDANDLVADSVLTVSGLRVASQALARLKNSGALDSSETARREAEALASAMRSSLDENVLLTDTQRRRLAGGRSGSARSGRVAETPQSSTPQPAKKDPVNPFSNLGADGN